MSSSRLRCATATGRGWPDTSPRASTKVLGRRVELTAIRASGEEFPVELAIARIASAGPAQFTGYIRDITERKRAEEALRQSEASLNRAQEIAHIGSWHLDVAQQPAHVVG